MNELNISDNIVRLRHHKKITQEQLAEFIGVTKASVSKWENRQSMPDIMILPQLAAFFDVTIDELIGYTPQLSKEQIQNLYQRFGTAFSEHPFEEVMSETEAYVKRYYSCYPFLLQVCVLWLNHYMLTANEERQNEILLHIAQLCEHIKSNCKNVRIHSNAVVLQSVIYLRLGRIREVIDELESVSMAERFGNQSSALLSQAYMMLGDADKANGFVQMSMYDNITNLMSNAMSYLFIHTDNLALCAETIARVEQVADIFHIMELNPNNLAAFEYQAAICYLTHGDLQKAVEHVDKYVSCLSKLFSSEELRLHGDAYFDKIEEWFNLELDNAQAPRNRKLVLEDSRKTLDVPPFTLLTGNPAFEKIKSKLKELR